MDKMIDKAEDKLKEYAVDKAKSEALQKVCSAVGNKLLDKTAATPSGHTFDISKLDVLGIGDINDNCSNIQDSNGGVSCAKSILSSIDMIQLDLLEWLQLLCNQFAMFK